jgi:hypothetical protein
MSTFPSLLTNRAAAMISVTKQLVDTAHQRLNTLGSQVSALTPGDWELLTLQNGWSNLGGYIPAQVRILQNGMSQLVGHIAGGTVSNGTTIGTLTSGFYNSTHAHSFTANVLAGASAVSVSGTVSGSVDTGALADGTISGTSSTNGLPDGTVGGSTSTNGIADGTVDGTTAAAAGPGSHTHGPGNSLAVASGQHSHTISGAVANGQHFHYGNSSGGTLAVTNDTHQHGSSALVPATPINYCTVILVLSTSGVLTIQNASSAATQLSFNETLPLVTS